MFRTFLVTCLICTQYHCLIEQQPQQVHLALGEDASTSVTITWVTLDEMSDVAQVEYGQVKSNLPLTFPLTKSGRSDKFVDGGSEGRIMYIHRVYLSSLKPNTRYYYHVGSSEGWSSIYFFKSLPQWPVTNGTTNSDVSSGDITVALLSDLGNENAQSIPRLQGEVAKGSIDLIIHLGDFAYDLHGDNGRTGDEFMKQLEPIAAYVPYQVVVGDHESAYNFSHFNARFTMVNCRSEARPQPVNNNHFYSFNVGPVHFVAFSTEFYFSVEYGWTQIAQQYAWLEADLKEANKEQNRKLRPWIVTLGHRPMYCSSSSKLSKCRQEGQIIRSGLPLIHAFSLEKLFFKYTVDIEIFAHQHMYERLYPVYNDSVFNGSLNDPYVNPKAPVHLITASAGSNQRLDEDEDIEDIESTRRAKYPWSALRLFDYGYTRMYISNSSHITFEQVSDDQNGRIVDSFTIVKDHHDPYPVPSGGWRRSSTTTPPASPSPSSSSSSSTSTSTSSPSSSSPMPTVLPGGKKDSSSTSPLGQKGSEEGKNESKSNCSQASNSLDSTAKRSAASTSSPGLKEEEGEKGTTAIIAELDLGSKSITAATREEKTTVGKEMDPLLTKKNESKANSSISWAEERI